jgi:ATP-binding cassette, subfamily B (MDR/TAP), member 1
MPVEWFDKSENNCGILSKRLGTDCQTINGMATTYIYIMIGSATTFVVGVIIALIYEWRTALVAIGFMPLVMLAGAIRTAFRSGLSEKEDAALKDSSQIVMESLTNIRTVVSFGVENTVLHKYSRYID